MGVRRRSPLSAGLVAGLSGVLLGAGLASGASAQSYSDVYVFGDSLSDSGNGCSVLQIAGYSPGRCSNGPVWSEQFAALLGLEAEAVAQGGTNFANGGDETGDLALQIDLFEISLFPDFEADPDALYVIWLGGNDILGTPSSPSATQDAVDNILDGIGDLQALGATDFLVLNLPDIGRAYGDFELPAGSGPVFPPAERDALTALSLDFNDRLATDLGAEPIATLYQLDVEALLEEVFADPAAFGISAAAIDTTSDDTDFAIPCLVDGPCSLDPQGPTAEGFILFDGIHPTTTMHGTIAARAAALLPEPGGLTGTLGTLAGAALLAALARRRA